MTTPITKEPLYAEVHNVPDDYHFTDAELERIIAGDMFTPRQGAIMARELRERRKAAMDAEPVGEVSEQPDGLVMDGTVHLGGSRTHRVIKGLNKMKRLPLGTKFYAAPPTPDGWKLIPVEPTEHMIVEGFESEPDESFSDEKEWKEYSAMSGCQQAAHRAKLCWAAMISAAPTAPEQQEKI